MTLRTMEKTFDLLEKVTRQPHKYMVIKNYVNTIFQNFDYETMKTEEAKQGLEIVVNAVRIFHEMRNWRGTREEEKPKENVSKLSSLTMPSWL